MMDMDIDWAGLRAAAADAMLGAYAPYSKFPVGAAALVDDGRIVRGCNVENGSYGLTLCAECGVVSALHASGGGRLVALSCVDSSGGPLMPCGRCRQLLWEHGGPGCLVDAQGGPVTMAELLPYAFELNADRTPSPAEPAPHLRDMLGRGTVFVHPDAVGGVRVWTAYWDGSTGVDAGSGASSSGSPTAAARTAILDEAPSRPDAADVIAWGLARTRRVIVVDAEGEMFWAGEGPAPAEIGKRWDPRD
jgi:cytidine deaminase